MPRNLSGPSRFRPLVFALLAAASRDNYSAALGNPRTTDAEPCQF